MQSQDSNPGPTLQFTHFYFIILSPKGGMEREVSLEIITRCEKKVVITDPDKSLENAEPEPNVASVSSMGGGESNGGSK